MKKIIVTAFAILLVLSLVGCQALTTQPVIQSKDSGGPIHGTPIIGKTETAKTQYQNQGIAINKISFKELTYQDLSEDMTQTIEKSKTKPGYQFFQDHKGNITLVVYSGERNTGGYGISVQSIEDNEGITNVVVKETKPEEGTMVNQMITYPLTIVTFSGTTDNFVVKNTEGKTFTLIK